MKQFKKDNSGLSLIELLIAVTIIALVAVPIMHSFITSANANARAKKTHKATVLGQSIMEGLKSEGLDDICIQFNYPDAGFRLMNPAWINDGVNLAGSVAEVEADYSATKNFEDLAEAEKAAGATNVTSSVYSPDGGADLNNIQFLGQGDDPYYFTMKNVEIDEMKYDVLITMDPKAYQDTTADADTDVDAGHRYNTDNFFEVHAIDLNVDALCIERDTRLESAAQTYQMRYSVPNLEDVKKKMFRTITIKVVKDPSTNVTEVKAEYVYKYHNVPTNYTDESERAEETIFTATSATDLRNVYLYYHPLYNAVGGDCRDFIVFENANGLPITFYLIKQKMSDTTLTAENNYKVDLSILDDPSVDVTSDATAMKTDVQTNLVLNMASYNYLTDLSNYDVKVNNKSCELGTITTADSILAQIKSNRVFDITVSIYEAGAIAQGFPESKRLDSLTGSRLF